MYYRPDKFHSKVVNRFRRDRFLCTDQVLRILDETSYFYGHRQVIRMGLSVDFKLQNIENVNVISVAIKRLYEFYF